MGRVILEVSPPASLASHHLHHYLPQQGINRLPQIDPSVSWENYLDTDQQLGSLSQSIYMWYSVVHEGQNIHLPLSALARTREALGGTMITSLDQRLGSLHIVLRNQG